jgi:LysM repeat protein
MSRKTLTQFIIIIIILTASFASAGSAQAWSGCGNTYVIQWGDTIGGIAARCGTSVSALLAANPWTNGYLYAGQVLAIPAGNYCNCPQNVGYTNTYVVQSGDIFSDIAQRYGVSTSQLWAANPNVWDINRIYAGQVLNVPSSSSSSSSSSSWFVVNSTTTTTSTTAAPLVERSYGSVLPGTQTGSVKMTNIANGQVYVSLQGTTNDGASVIKEYPVEGTMKVNVPNGWYVYVAWVGGEEHSGQFQLHGGENLTMVFYPHKVVVK